MRLLCYNRYNESNTTVMSKQPEVQFLRINDVRDMTQLSRSTIYRLMASGEFPQNIQLTKRSVVWVKTHVTDWCNEKVKAATYTQ